MGPVACRVGNIYVSASSHKSNVFPGGAILFDFVVAYTMAANCAPGALVVTTCGAIPVFVGLQREV